MGQMFYSAAYNIEDKTCISFNVDKFHASCYSHSGNVAAVHYLLRQKPHRVMWIGDYVTVDDNFARFDLEEDIMGISTTFSYEWLEENIEDLKDKSYYDKILRLKEYKKQWTKLDIWDEALAYFDMKNTKSVKYEGFLLNHSKHLAVDLKKYLECSQYTVENITCCADLVPILTETGGGSLMLFFNGMVADTTEKLIGKWCGDELQIVDDLPEGYELIECCFCEIWSKTHYCVDKYGLKPSGAVKKNEAGELLVGVPLGFRGNRGIETIIRVEKTADSTSYIPEPLDWDEKWENDNA
jgi:hypothetical protein